MQLVSGESGIEQMAASCTCACYSNCSCSYGPFYNSYHSMAIGLGEQTEG
ncbi:MAG: hypothetical protein WC379_08380 [Methanoregula sp.]